MTKSQQLHYGRGGSTQPSGHTILEPAQLSVVFLCYQEPERHSFFERLKTQAPQAVKVEGVKGFDAAHKAAAEAATTDYFVLVDGDAIVKNEFWQLRLRIPESLARGALSFCALNVVNDLCYGYGGLKIWHRDFVRTMMTHENATTLENAFEFCWQPNYHHFATCWNETHINQSPEQAFCAGFREATKLLCPRGIYTQISKLDYWVQRKLGQWMMLGADAKNGEYAMAGAVAAYHELHRGSDPKLVNDYEYISSIHGSYCRDLHRTYLLAPDGVKPLSPGQSLAVKKHVRRPRPHLSYPLEPCQNSTE